ncbi:hypothetical protein [Sphingomonas sp. Leaf339]|nr:hypothetical protein [Sphingomonas sp. Leaf339]
MLEDARALALLQREQSLPQRLEYLSKVLERLTALITAAATLVDHDGEAS